MIQSTSAGFGAIKWVGLSKRLTDLAKLLVRHSLVKPKGLVDQMNQNIRL